MDESELTRKAIEELMKEMSEYKEKESLPTERKINPLGKPNKRFLGRTINSMLTHNKRQHDRNYQQCQRKLKELDVKQRKRDYYERYRNHRKEPRRRSKSESSHEVVSSSSDEGTKHKNSKKLKKKKKKKRKKKEKSSSSSSNTSSSSSSDSTNSSSRSKIKKRKHKNQAKGTEEYQVDYYSAVANDPGFNYYIDPNMAYAAMAYNEMQRMLHQQQLAQQQLMKEELEESAEILSDLSLSCADSGSSLNISLHTSSAEEDENGILTFQLSSDDENAKHIKKKCNENGANSHPTQEDDMQSVLSHISLESDKSLKLETITISQVFVLNTSSSDSELEIVETEEKVSESTANKPTDEEITNKVSVIKDIDILDKSSNNMDSVDKIIEESEDLNKTSNDQSILVKEKECVKTSENISMVDLTDD